MLDLQLRGRVAEVLLDGPPVNSINDVWIETMNGILDQIEALDDCSVVLFRSGLKLFSAGFDLKLAAERFARIDGAREMGRSTENLQALYDRIERLPVITIAEIGGTAMGGGLELALACDIRIVADESKLGLPELKLGLLPAAGGTQRLSRICGQATALRLILGSEIVDGKTAAQLGLVQWSVARDELQEFTAATVERFSRQSPHVLGWAKRCIAASADPAMDGSALEREGAETMSGTPQTRALVDEFFARA